MEDRLILTLKEKEKELLNELKESAIYKKWESVKTTISMFEGNNLKAIENSLFNNEIEDDIIYDENLTWKQKVLYALNKLDGKAGYKSDIIKELQKVDKNSEVDLEKRVGVTISVLLKNKTLHIIQKSGKKIKVTKK